MLPVPLSFSGRLGRSAFFKWSLALFLFCVVTALLGVHAYDQYRAGSSAGMVATLLLVALSFVVVIWSSVALQVQRCRDIGWNPAVMIPIWIAVELLDPFIAYLVPGVSIGDSTAFGTIYRFGWTLVLFFWPSGEGSGVSPAQPSPQLYTGPRSRVEALQAGKLGAHKEDTSRVAGPAGVSPSRVVFGRR